MQKGEVLSKLLMQFFMIYTATMFATVAFCLLTNPQAEFSLSYFWETALFSLCADLVGLVYYSKNELTRKQARFRTLAHTVLLEVVLMTAGYHIGMYNGWLGAALFFVTVLVVDVFVRLCSYLMDQSTAGQINMRLKQARMEQNDGGQTGGENAKHH